MNEKQTYKSIGFLWVEKQGFIGWIQDVFIKQSLIQFFSTHQQQHHLLKKMALFCITFYNLLLLNTSPVNPIHHFWYLNRFCYPCSFLWFRVGNFALNWIAGEWTMILMYVYWPWHFIFVWIFFSVQIGTKHPCRHSSVTGTF